MGAAPKSDILLKSIFVVLGIALLIASFYAGYEIGRGAAKNGADDGNGGIVDTAGKVVITEYSDFQCPFCGRFFTQTYGQIKSTYGDKVVFEFKEFPLSFHPNAQKAAEAAECARDQEKFWEMHDKLFVSQDALDVANLKAYAEQLGLDTATFNACLDSGVKAAIITQHMQEGAQRGVSGTPSFWINGELVVGAQPFAVFQQKIDAALRGEKPVPPAPEPEPEPTGPVDVSIDDDAVLGKSDAKVVIVEFTDYECPYCKRHATQTVPSIIKNFIETGKARYVVRDFPLSFHPSAQKAAEAAECAGEQGKYFEMHDKLFAASALDVASLKTLASELGLDTAKFNTCLDSGAMAAEVAKDEQDGASYGVRGTPAIFVDGVLISGAQPYSVFEAAINAALGQ